MSPDDVSIRVSVEAHEWLMKNRGAQGMKMKIDSLIAENQELHRRITELEDSLFRGR